MVPHTRSQERVRTLVKALTLDRSSYLLLFGVLSIILNQASNATPSEKKNEFSENMRKGHLSGVSLTILASGYQVEVGG